MKNRRSCTLFALDCGATNWRLYRAEYEAEGERSRLIAEPQPAPMTSFVDRRLPAVLCLDPSGAGLESFGETAQQQLEDELARERVRDYFKPCIGAHLDQNPLPHQKRYTHAQALRYTQMLLRSVLEQIRVEKNRSSAFDDRTCFTFAFPIYWKSLQGEQIFQEFSRTVRDCFAAEFKNIRFVSEPEGAIRCLEHRGLLAPGKAGGKTWIVDIGGSTTDIVAGQVEESSGRLEYLGHYGEPFGGGLYDSELAKYIADELQIPASALTDDPSAMVSLRVSAQRFKESLSRQMLTSSAPAHLSQRTITLVMRDGKIYRRLIALDDARFREIVRVLDDRFSDLTERALEATGVRADDIGQVLLVGGGSQLFTILGYLRDRFGSEKVILADNPDEIVVQGISLEYGESQERELAEVVKAGTPERSLLTKEASQSEWTLQRTDGQILKLSFGVCRLGRGEGNAIRLDDPKASRFHAELIATEDRLEIHDLGSANGTWVNDRKLTPHQTVCLSPGDTIRIGTTQWKCWMAK
jgi:molecular chaperone DnaK (HSP70)